MTTPGTSTGSSGWSDERLTTELSLQCPQHRGRGTAEPAQHAVAIHGAPANDLDDRLRRSASPIEPRANGPTAARAGQRSGVEVVIVPRHYQRAVKRGHSPGLRGRFGGCSFEQHAANAVRDRRATAEPERLQGPRGAADQRQVVLAVTAAVSSRPADLSSAAIMPGQSRRVGSSPSSGMGRVVRVRRQTVLHLERPLDTPTCRVLTGHLGAELCSHRSQVGEADGPGRVIGATLLSQ